MGLLKTTCSLQFTSTEGGARGGDGCRRGRGHQGARAPATIRTQVGTAALTAGRLLLPDRGLRWGGQRWVEMPGLDPVTWPSVPNWVGRKGRHSQVFACSPASRSAASGARGSLSLPCNPRCLPPPTSSVPRLDPKGWRKLRPGIPGAREVLLPAHQGQRGSVCRPGCFLRGHLLLQDHHTASPESPNPGRTGGGRGNVPEPRSGLTLT